MSDDAKTDASAEPAKTRVEKQWKHALPLISCRFDPQGRFVFAGAQDYTIQRWELATDKQTSLAGHGSWVRALAFDPQGETLISGGYDGQLIWWPAAEEQPVPLRTIAAHDGWIRAAAVSPDGQMLATCGHDCLVKLWSLEGVALGTLAGHERHVSNLAFHPGGGHLASLDIMGVLKHWDLESGKELRQVAAADLHKYDTTFKADIGGARGMQFSADGKLLACGGITNVSNAFAGVGNPGILLLDWEKGEKTQLLVTKSNHRGSVWGLDFHPQGFVVSVAGGGGGGLLVFHKPEEPQEFFQMKLPNTGRDMHLHPGGLDIAVAHYDSHVRIYRMQAKPS